MGADEYFVNHRGRVLVEAEGIEGGCRIGIEQCLTQSIGVDISAVALHATIFAITERGFPVPCLKIISKLTQITFEAASKLVVIRRNLEGARPGFQRTVSNTGGELSAGRGSTRIKSSGRGVIRDREWIEWVLNGYGEAKPRGSEPDGVRHIRPYIRCKLNRRLGAIPESARIFEVSKKLQVLVANFAVERAIEIVAVDSGECRS